MKNIFRKSVGLRICILLLGFMIPNVSHGQNVIYDLAPFQSEYSIIRHYKDNVDITYSMFTCDEKVFYCVDRLNNIVYRANLPCIIDVFDMRIHEDYLYFCGRRESKAISGWFKIDNLFLYGGDISIMTLPSVYPVSPDRRRPLRRQGGEAMTASAKFDKRSLPRTPQLAGAFLRGVWNST